MKKLLTLIALGCCIALLTSACVTKKKYQELESQYKECTDDKQFATNELNDCRNQKKDPEKSVADLQAKVDQLNLQTGAKTVNEIRAEHDMPAVEKGNIVYITTNVAELGSTKLSGESATELKPGNYTVKQPQNNQEDDETK